MSEYDEYLDEILGEFDLDSYYEEWVNDNGSSEEKETN